MNQASKLACTLPGGFITTWPAAASALESEFPAGQRGGLEVLQSPGLRLVYTVDTHIHAGHITAARYLKERVGSKIAAPTIDRLRCVDVGMCGVCPGNLPEQMRQYCECMGPSAQG